MMHTRNIHGYKVFGGDDVAKGMDYLDHRLEYSEAIVFFKSAKTLGKADFEDDRDNQFTLKYNGDGTYQMLRRKKSGGIFSGWF